MPATVRDAIRRRLGLLPRPTLDVLAVAAVSTATWTSRWSPGSPGIELDECAERLDPAADHRVLVRRHMHRARLRFSHALVREVLVDGLTPLRRARVQVCRVADRGIDAGDERWATTTSSCWPTTSGGPRRWASASGLPARSSAPPTSPWAASRTRPPRILRRAVQLRRDAAALAGALQAQLDAQLRLLAVMQATRFFSGTDRDLLQNTQELARQLGHDDVSRELTWSEWAALSRAARAAAERSRRTTCSGGATTRARPSERVLTSSTG